MTAELSSFQLDRTAPLESGALALCSVDASISAIEEEMIFFLPLSPLEAPDENLGSRLSESSTQ